jgi:16S rRNA (adenine1518-N6/adenine1519-N6)-dimethyltransferase
VLGIDFAGIAERMGLGGASLAVAGNLPYYVSKPIAQKIVRERQDVSRAVLMFQREVAARLTATPGGREYGPLTVYAGAAFRIERLFDVAPDAFRPRPAVHSAVTRWTPRNDGLLDGERERRLRRCLAASFGRRRKTVFNNLRATLPGGDEAARELLDRAGLDPSVRPEADLWPAADLA